MLTILEDMVAPKVGYLDKLTQYFQSGEVEKEPQNREEVLVIVM